MSSRRPHTQGNPDTEILPCVDDPSKLFRNKGKEQSDIPQLGDTSTQEFHSIQDSVWETNFEGSLLKSKLESDLRDTELNPSRLDSYLLDSLW